MLELNMRKAIMVNAPFFKFPSTPHISFSSENVLRSDKLIDAEEKEILLSNIVTIEEKIDGANLGISFTSSGDILLQNRGQYLIPPLDGQWKNLPMWLSVHQDLLFDVLEDRYILFGEWCFAKHSLAYSKLPDWFIGFDIFDSTVQKFLAVPVRNRILEKLDIAIVPQIQYGKFTIDDIPKLLRQSSYGECPCEGLYFRYDVDNWLEIRAKYVRSSFTQSIDYHWKRCPFQKNKIQTW